MRGVAEIVGRDVELRRIEDFLAGSAGLPGTLLLSGEAGIGKTTLWELGAARAEATVLLARPSGAEAGMSLAGLGDLLRDVGDDVFAELPEPQRRRLAAALLLSEPDEAPEPRALGLALLGVLTRLAARGPVLVAVDDVQWLDPPSAGALAFALRRLRDEPVRVLLSLRDGWRVPAGLDSALPSERLEVGPLSFGALRSLLQARFPRPVLRRIHETAGGNPFYALELARALERQGGEIAAGGALPVPATLGDLLRERLAGLPPATAEALLLVAASGDARLGAVDAAALDPAIDAGVLRLDGAHLRFTHPLLRAAIYADASPARRRRAHLLLADAATGKEERARHLSLATTEPEAEAAAEIAAGAEEAARRGAPEAAAELLERAAELTPPGERELRAARLAAAASRHVESGNEARASQLLRPLLDDSISEEAGVDVLLALSRAESEWRTSREFGDRALALVGGDDARRARVLTTLAYAAMHRMDNDYALELAAEAVAAAEAAGDPKVLLDTLAREGWLLRAADDGRAVQVLERALVLEQEVGEAEPYQGPGTWLGWLWVDAERPDLARPLLERQYRRARSSGHEHGRRWLCGPLTELELRAGRFAPAARYAEEGLALAEEVGSAHSLSAFLGFRAQAAAFVGDLEQARRDAVAALELARDCASQLFDLRARRVLGFVELSDADPAAAVRVFEPVEELLAGGIRSITVRDAEHDVVEALAAAGELDRAEAVARAAEAAAAQSLAGDVRALRARGVVEAARGDVAAAAAALERALELGEELQAPFPRARTLLDLGVSRRRAKRKRPARDALEAAAAIFDAIGARVWAERARAELQRVAGRRGSPASELTPSERRVAELVAQGKSNKEVAAELFVTPRTIEAHLTKAYEKLGVRSRTELARRLAGG